MPSSPSCAHEHEHQHSKPTIDSAPGDEATFRVPTRQILTPEDLARFLESDCYEEYLGFIIALNEQVVGKPTRTDCHISPVVEKLLNIIKRLSDWVDEIQPVHNEQSRFGNPAFRTWYDRVAENASDLLKDVVPEEAIPEVSKYLVESFGNHRRIDYGTGHEANFIAWMLCIKKLNLIHEEDYAALVLKLFYGYIDLMRKLQFAYWLEPAGSHGVWGLDDYHFLPFLFGAAQLRGHKHIRPKAIHDQDIVEEFSKDYMYLACIKFVNNVKTASLRWHSPMLDDISGVKTWDKVNSGMIKMYKAEVLGKLPIMQHFMFGSLLRFEGSQNVPDEDDDCCEVAHVYAYGQEAPTCCGMRVPSAIAASQSAKRLPFD
ncbi:putative serine/threonine-protein phosphatase 2A activator [Basidiobolus meristosporus CBS 931.73]|uniref:Serine/threonine-protein phosphatase 2A activator n=1 Tax=Basidiobolus meristosporus CBS 931.73 TaxID=1314790 RepID=A0A1Y1Z0L4_9FUNG|nr:putative serine/threonine-protein phosphatase 2A activator [Basidiobolus meristosporus CBS 931.73]|eukprot:ORY03355.1 putative serine/threonine-protein phosphatase 2A activator [Basidiobolus meristosporus CBS 931.73]